MPGRRRLRRSTASPRLREVGGPGADQQDQGEGQQGDDHHQLEVVGVGDDGRLLGDEVLEQRTSRIRRRIEHGRGRVGHRLIEGRRASARCARIMMVLLVRLAMTMETPIELPRLRISVHMAVPSVRSACRNGRQRDGVERHEHEAEPRPLQDADPDDGAHGGVGGEVDRAVERDDAARETHEHGRFVRGWSYGFLERLLGDLEQTGRADLQTRKERRREEQREPLTLVRLDLELVQLRVNAQHRRPYGSRAGVTQLDLLGHESPHAQDDGAAAGSRSSSGAEG